MAQYLIIVARTQPDLHSYLTQHFSGDADVQVLLDRRQRVQLYEPERRRAAGQRPPSFADALQTLGVVVARTQ